MSDEQIGERISEMDHVTCRPRQIAPCYWKIDGWTGAILRVLIVMSHLTSGTGRAQIFDVDSTVVVSAFVPASSRAPEKFVPYTAAEMISRIVVHDVGYDILREEFSVYSTSDGTIVSARRPWGRSTRPSLSPRTVNPSTS